MTVLRLACNKTFLTGVVFAGIGAAALWFDQDYQIGRATAMGPGYVPMLIATLLIVLGLSNMLISWRTVSAAPFQLPGLRALALLVLGAVLFGLCIDRFGLLPSVLCLVLCATGVGVRYRMWEVVVILLILCAISGALFVFGMGLPIGYLVRF
jgi:putative tricarboxylic transport membrane protein